MMMNIDKFTTKSQGIIAAARFQLRTKREREALHLLSYTEDIAFYICTTAS